MFALRDQYKAWVQGNAGNLQVPIETVREAVNEVLDIAKVKRRQVIVMDGPLLAQLAANALRGGVGKNLADNLLANIWANLGANPGANLEANLEANLGDNLWANLKANLADNLADNLRVNLGANLAANLEANLRANLKANLKANLRDNLRANLADNLRVNLGANLAANLEANLRANLKANLGDSIWANLGTNLAANLEANLGDNLRANLKANLGDSIWANLGANLGDNLADNLKANLRANLKANLEKTELEFQPFDWFGSSGQWWIAYYDHIATSLMPERVPTDMRASIDAVKRLVAVGVAGALTYENAIIVWRRPVYATYDDVNRPHGASGPSVLWQDGFKQYAWHGLDLTKRPEIIDDPANLTAAKALAEPNVEVRRAMVEIMGVQRFLAGAEASVVDEVAERDVDGNSTKCRLLRLKVDGGQADLALMEVVCPSTRKTIHLEVPIEVATSYAKARAWQSFSPEETKQSDGIWES